MKTYIIKKGKHSASGLNFGLTFRDKIKFRACFTESCLYDLHSNDNYDINKLFGFSTTSFHHIQSARVGWRCIDKKHIELLTYSYNDSKRAIDEADVLGKVLPNQWFTCEIIDKEDFYEYRFFLENNKDMTVNIAHDKKQKDWFLFHYLLFPYFGGNKTAPHDMKILLKRL
jgi:transposase-like protein